VAVLALPFSEPGIVTRAVYDEPFRVAMPTGHPLCESKSVSAEALATEQLLLLGQGNCFRDQVVQACPRRTDPGGLERSLEGSSLETLRHMVASGAGISVVPASAVESWPRDEKLMSIRPFSPPVPNRRVVLAWRVTFPRPQAIDALRAAILDAPPAGVFSLP
jgi:LysR family hydrogen peroxide-inducible transcriptional activator